MFLSLNQGGHEILPPRLTVWHGSLARRARALQLAHTSAGQDDLLACGHSYRNRGS
jgi:hypothetical protein